MKAKSPCINVCKLNPKNNLCEGCLRTSEEISNWSKYVKQDERYMRPAEVAVLCGDSTKAREQLGWKPKTSFEQMVANMVDNDLKLSKVWLS